MNSTINDEVVVKKDIFQSDYLESNVYNGDTAPPKKTEAVADIVQNIDFATEVKTDRLQVLWKATVAVTIFILALSLTLIASNRLYASLWVGAPVILIAASLITRFFLKRERFTAAAWAYTLGSVIAFGFGLYTTETLLHNLVPFTFIPVVFITGLLLRPVHSLYITLIAMVAVLTVPSLATGSLEVISGYQIFAIFLMIIAVALAMQVTGELYAVTEWALMNYSKERNTNKDLFESRMALEKSLKRSEALSDRLQLLNNELENARAAAEAAKNFRGQFLANMSHELRTPLNAIIGFSETMLKFPIMYEGVELPENYKNDLTMIYNSGKHLLNLINDILDLAKIDAGKMDVRLEEVELDHIVDSTMAMANGLLGGKPVRLIKDVPAVLPTVYGDPNRVRQVMVNLYSNATKFTDNGSITLKIVEEGEWVHFSLTDTGSGIYPENLDLIFEEFKQGEQREGRDPRSGSGLGLAITRQLLNLMGGRIWAESVKGEGSTFHFSLQAFRLNEEETTQTRIKRLETLADNSAVQ